MTSPQETESSLSSKLISQKDFFDQLFTLYPTLAKAAAWGLSTSNDWFLRDVEWWYSYKALPYHLLHIYALSSYHLCLLPASPNSMHFPWGPRFSSPHCCIPTLWKHVQQMFGVWTIFSKWMDKWANLDLENFSICSQVHTSIYVSCGVLFKECPVTLSFKILVNRTMFSLCLHMFFFFFFKSFEKPASFYSEEAFSTFYDSLPIFLIF